MSLSQILHRQLRWVGIHSSTAWPGASWGSGGSWWEKCMKCYRLHSWVFSKRCVRRKIFKLYTYIYIVTKCKLKSNPCQTVKISSASTVFTSKCMHHASDHASRASTFRQGSICWDQRFWSMIAFCQSGLWSSILMFQIWGPKSKL